MCQFCNTEENDSGENIPIEVKVDGTKQDYDATILCDIENEQMSLAINGTFSELRIKIEFCPMCGQKLYF